MEEYTILDTPPALWTREQTGAVLNISLECDDAYLEFRADPNDRTITIASVTSPDDDLAFDVEDFALVTTLLIRQAQRGL
jgi:hypothetical protein